MGAAAIGQDALCVLSAVAASGALIRQCRQCNRNLTLIRIDKPNGCFSELLVAGLDPLLPLNVLDC